MAEDFEPLREKHLKAVQDTQARLQQWRRYGQDYDALHSRLQTLPDSITHDVMVPFGSKAFFHGQLVHTNEVTVLLGDNWFVERSARQAQAIVGRRQAHLNEMITNSEKVLSDLCQRVDATAAFSSQPEDDVKDIREELEEDEYEDAARQPAEDDLSSTNATMERDQPVSQSAALAPRSRRIAHKSKEVKGRVAHPPRNAFPSSKDSSLTMPSAPVSSAGTTSASSKQLPPTFEELTARLRNAEESEAIPIAKAVKPSTDSSSTRHVNFQHSSDKAGGKDVDWQGYADTDSVSTPGEIYNRFLDQQLQRTIHGQPSLLGQDGPAKCGDSNSVGEFSPDVNLTAMSRLQIRESQDDEDDDDDDCEEHRISEPATAAVDIATASQRSSLKKAGKLPKSGHVRFDAEPHVKEFDKRDTPGPKALPAVAAVESVIGAVKERGPGLALSAPQGPSSQLQAAQEVTAVKEHVVERAQAQSVAEVPSQAPASTRPKSKFKANRHASKQPPAS